MPVQFDFTSSVSRRNRRVGTPRQATRRGRARGGLRGLGHGHQSSSFSSRISPRISLRPWSRAWLQRLCGYYTQGCAERVNDADADERRDGNQRAVAGGVSAVRVFVPDQEARQSYPGNNHSPDETRTPHEKQFAKRGRMSCLSQLPALGAPALKGRATLGENRYAVKDEPTADASSVPEALPLGVDRPFKAGFLAFPATFTPLLPLLPG